MRRAFPLALTLAALGTGAAPAGAAETPAGPAETPAYAPNRVIVQYKAGADRPDARDDVDATSAKALDLPRTEVVSLPAGSSVPAAVRELEGRDDVAFAQPDILYKPESTVNDEFFDIQWGLDNIGQKIPETTGTFGTPDADIDAPFAWDVTTGDSGVIVGVMDTGVNIGHEDLTDNVFTNATEATGSPGVDDDNNGKVDDVHGWDFVNLDGYVSDDFADHGTTVASVVGARGNNLKGTTGVAQQVTLLPLQVVNSNGFLSSSAMVDAIGYAHDEGARIVNMSFGRYYDSENGTTVDDLTAFDNAVTTAIEENPQILFSASAGNLNGANQPNDNDSEVKHWPSNLSVDHANVVSEANTTNQDLLSGDSSFGATSVDLGAPGTLIAGASSINDDSELYFSEKFDTTATDALPSGWTTDGAWAVTASDSNSQPKSLTDSPAGTYTPNSDTSVTSPAFDVPADATCTVRNARNRKLLASDDFSVAVALDGAAFNVVDHPTTPPSAGWFQRRPPATFDSGSATSAQVRFRLAAGAGPADGVYVDDVQVLCVPDIGTSYVYASGTSFATPMTSGAAALLLAKRPSLTAADLKTILKGTVDLLPSLTGKVATGGRLNVGRAVHELVDPTATTGGADVSTTGVTLHSAIDPTGSPAAVHFEYRVSGETDWTSTGAAAVPETSPSGTDAKTNLTELTPNANYEYQVVVVKAVGSLELAHVEGGTQTFHVPADFTGPIQPNGGGGGQPTNPGQTTGTPPSNPPVNVPPKDTTAPKLTGLKVAPTAFLPLRAGASIARALKKKPTPRGATLRFRVDERSTVSARVLVRKAGRRKGRSCVAPTRANRRAKACVRYVALGGAAKLSGSFSGLATRRLSGRVGNKALKAGAYRLELTPTDAAGNRGRPVSVAFRIATR